MCSTRRERLAQLRAAIEALAAESGQPESPVRSSHAPTGRGAAGDGSQAYPADPADSAEDIDDRLSRLWAMIAELDPELARRLPRYLA